MLTTLPMQVIKSLRPLQVTDWLPLCQKIFLNAFFFGGGLSITMFSLKIDWRCCNRYMVDKVMSLPRNLTDRSQYSTYTTKLTNFLQKKSGGNVDEVPEKNVFGGNDMRWHKTLVYSVPVAGAELRQNMLLTVNGRQNGIMNSKATAKPQKDETFSNMNKTEDHRFGCHHSLPNPGIWYWICSPRENAELCQWKNIMPNKHVHQDLEVVPNTWNCRRLLSQISWFLCRVMGHVSYNLTGASSRHALRNSNMNKSEVKRAQAVRNWF